MVVPTGLAQHWEPTVQHCPNTKKDVVPAHDYIAGATIHQARTQEFLVAGVYPHLKTLTHINHPTQATSPLTEDSHD